MTKQKTILIFILLALFSSGLFAATNICFNVHNSSIDYCFEFSEIVQYGHLFHDGYAYINSFGIRAGYNNNSVGFVGLEFGFPRDGYSYNFNFYNNGRSCLFISLTKEKIFYSIGFQTAKESFFPYLGIGYKIHL
jgi:hypothetical protein